MPRTKSVETEKQERKKGSAIEITLPQSVNDAIEAALTRRPLLRKLHKEIKQAHRDVALSAAVAAVSGASDTIIDKVLAGELGPVVPTLPEADED